MLVIMMNSRCLERQVSHTKYLILMSKAKAQNTPSYGWQAKELATYAKQFMLPIECDGRPVVAPSRYPSQVCSRHLHKVIDVSSATPAYADGFTVCMFPDLYNPGFISNPTLINVPEAAPSLISCSGSISPTSNISQAQGVLKVEDSQGVSSRSPLIDIADNTATIRQGISLVPGAASNYNVEFRNQDNFPVGINFHHKINGGAWVTVLASMSNGQTQNLSGILPLNTNAIAFSFSSQAPHTSVKVTLSLTNSRSATAEATGFSPAFENFIIDNGVTAGRVISMSILVTNTSPDIADGGNINVGRVPHVFNPYLNVSSSLSNLPSNRRYQGPAAKGGYVNWIPSQYDEFEVDTIGVKREILSEAEYLIVKVSGWNPPVGSTASARIQFDWIVEFYTQNQLFEKSVCPMMTSEFDLLLHLMLTMDAATCNPGHLDTLKKILKKGVGTFEEGKKLYKQHEVLINGVLKLLGTMLV